MILRSPRLRFALGALLGVSSQLAFAAPHVGDEKPAHAKAAPANPASLGQVSVGASEFMVSEDACSPSESWKLNKSISPELANEFRDLIKRDSKPVRGFSHALALRRFAQSEDARAFSAYWISRSLYKADLVHISYEGFSAIASMPSSPEIVGVQLAALECLSQIQDEHPSLQTPAAVIAKLPEFKNLAKTPAQQKSIYKAAASVLRFSVGQEQMPSAMADEMLSLLKGSGHYEALSRGFYHSRRREHRAATAQFEKFFQPGAPKELSRYSNVAHLLAARSYYSGGAFPNAVDHYKQISKSSNELAMSLQELSWAYLMSDQLGEAIGTAINLEAGGLRHTFAPEAPMVMSMALNELCQYPESIRAINTFKKNYEKPYQWLSKWKTTPTELYPLAVEYVKRKKGVPSTVPDRVASEWIRSPTFISSQEELNLLFEQSQDTAKLGKSGASEELLVAQEILKAARELKPKLAAAKAKVKAGQAMPKSVSTELAALKRKVLELRKIQQAGPVWKLILANYVKKVPATASKLIARINSDLNRRSLQMTMQLEEIAENLQLVEVEIYNGASQDIIWQNAHPDYKNIAAKMKDEREKKTAEKVWDWGKMSASEGATEVWEDELGSFKANLLDNCSSKDKYLALKRGR